MNAKEAREKASQKIIEGPQLAEIRKLIEKAVSKGEYHCWYYDELIHDEVRKELLSDGYKVGNTINDRNDLLTEIKW